MFARYSIVFLMLTIFLIPGFLKSDIIMKEKIQRSGFQMMGQTQPGEEMIRTTWISKDKMRSDDKDQSVIMLLDKKVMYMVNHQQKTYMEMPMDMGKIMQQKMEEEGVDQDEMQKYMNMAKGMMKMKIMVTPTQEKKKIGEWNCSKYILNIESAMGPITNEIWATEDLIIDYDLYAKFSSAFLGQQPGAQQMMDDIVQEMKKIKGVHVLSNSTVNMMGTTVKTSQELIEFKEGSIPAGTFDLPKGYKLQKME